MRVIFGCALASLLLAMTGAVAAQPALKRLSNGVSKATLLADGSRLVWRDAEGIHTLGDGKPWSAAKVVRSAPPACSDWGFGDAPARFIRIHSGLAEYRCDLLVRDRGAYVQGVILVDLSTGRDSVPAGFDAWLERERNDPYYLGVGEGLGSTFIAMEECGDKGGCSDGPFLNWHTGELRGFFPVPFRLKGFDPAQFGIFSLDNPRGWTWLCPPLYIESHVVHDDYGDYNEADPAYYFKPLLYTLHPGRLMFQRCGHGQSKVLVRGRYDAFATSRYLAWSTPGWLHIRTLRSQRELNYRLYARRLGRLSGTPGTLIVRTPNNVVRFVDLTPRPQG